MGQAHRRGLIHRDLKPQNIIITPGGEPKVMDFGLAKSMLSDSNYTVATMEGQVIGSPAYMSPEQASGRRDAIGPPSDVFALGVVLYQCLCSKLPHAADTPMETIFRVVHEDPEPLTAVDPTIGDDLNAICMKALEKSPSRRYADASLFAADLRRWLQNQPVLARPAGVTYRVGKALKRNSDVAVIAGVAATFLAVTISASLWLFASYSARQAAEGLHAELKTVANTAALMFARPDMDRIVAHPEKPDDAFHAVVLRLNDIRRRNPRIRNAYLFRVADSDNRLLYLADADAYLRKGSAIFRVGQPWLPPEGSSAIHGLRDAVADDTPIIPRRGTHWTGYAPVTDADGRAVGLLAVEMNADTIRLGMRPALDTTIQLGAIAAVLFLGFTAVAGFRVFRGNQKYL